MNTVKEELCTLLDLLSGDLNYDSVAKAKNKLKELVETKEATTMWFSPIHTPQTWKVADHRKILHDLRRSNSCLLASGLIGHERGDCAHFVGLPEVEDQTTTDEYGRPHDWCEVCWANENRIRLVSVINSHQETINSLLKTNNNLKESVIQQALQTDEGRKALAASMVEPIRTTLEYS